MVHLCGNGASAARAALLAPDPCLTLSDGRTVRIVPEYKYLGVPQRAKDNGRRDIEAAANRGNSVWTQASPLVHSPALPWQLKLAWLGRTLPAAYTPRLPRQWPGPRELWGRCVGFATSVFVSSLVRGPCHLSCMPGLLGGANVDCALAIARIRLLCRVVSGRSDDALQASWERDGLWTGLLRRRSVECGQPLRLAGRAHFRGRATTYQASLGWDGLAPCWGPSIGY